MGGVVPQQSNKCTNEMPLDQSDNISAASLRILLIQNVQLPRTAAATTQSSYETVTTTARNVPRHLDNYNQHKVTITVRATLTNRMTMRREAAPFSNGRCVEKQQISKQIGHTHK